jgi:hypothetical protein
MRALLKMALRTLGLRCVRVHERDSIPERLYLDEIATPEISGDGTTAEMQSAHDQGDKESAGES